MSEIAKRIEKTLTASFQSFMLKEDVDDIQMLSDIDALKKRYGVLKHTMGFSEASALARIEFIEGVLVEHFHKDAK